VTSRRAALATSLDLGVAAMLLAGCLARAPTLQASPPATSPEARTPTTALSATPPAPTAGNPPTPTPNGWFSGIDTLLPPECWERDEAVHPSVYENLGFASGACKLPTLSPDGSHLAYVLAVRAGDPGSWLYQEVRIVEPGQASPVDVYRAVYYTIHGLMWSADGRLVITDAQIEGGGGDTVIFDPNARQIVRTVPGLARERRWNSQSTAFYTMLYDGIYGPICANRISGYDFVHDVLVPDLQFASEDAEVLRVIGSPVWTPDGNELWVVVRPGRRDPASGEYVYGPASIVAIDVSDTAPRQVTLFSDPSLDYSLEPLPGGGYEASASPHRQRTCEELP